MGEDLLSLKWNNHKPAFFHLLRTLREKGCHTDVTLACGSRFFNVHRLVLMACSDFFSEVFQHTACTKPVIVLKDIRGYEMEALLDYMYLGEVDVQQTHLPGLIKAAECLRIKGLAVPDEDPIARPSSPPQAKRRRVEQQAPGADSPDPQLEEAPRLPKEETCPPHPDPGAPPDPPPDPHLAEDPPAPHTVLYEPQDIKLEQDELVEELEGSHMKREATDVKGDSITDDIHLGGAGADFQHFLSVDENLARHMFQGAGGTTHPLAGTATHHHPGLQQQQHHHHQPGPSGVHRTGGQGREGCDANSEEGLGSRVGGGGGATALYPPHLLGEATAVPPDGSSTQSHSTQADRTLSHGALREGGAAGLAHSISAHGQHYECVFCGRVFNHRGTLTRHVMIHTGEKPFTCHHCDFRTSRKSTLTYHLHSLHPTATATPTTLL